ncbi:TPA: EscU/YscU/HrcU family type III secretion system export apparatus switch protein, partial [Shigella sonnei]
TKSRRRELHIEILSEQTKSDIRNSKLVVMNPTHIAIGIYFNPEIAPAPFISLIETNQCALAVRKYANEVGIPTVRD